MPWSCSACTYLNAADSANRCSICNLPRADADDLAGATTTTAASRKRSAPSSSSSSSANTVQATLFGGVAASAEAKAQSKKTKKDPNDSVKSRQGTLAFFGSASTKSTLNNIRPGTDVARECQDLARRECCFFVNDHDSHAVTLSELKKRASAAMKHVFGIAKLRALQPQAISTVLRRQSQLVIMATGNGKSLCFQLPAVVLGGTTICVSPLLALMQDQRDALIKKGVEAAVISSSQTVKQNDDIMERLLGRSLKAAPKSKRAETKAFKHITILFVTPEQVQSSRFRDALSEMYQKKQLALFAIDEAHCISSWGHDFRKAYMRLDYLRDSFPEVPLLACTATATPRVIQDIKKLLRLENSPCHIGSFDRPNIFYKVKYKNSLDASAVGGAKGDMVRFIQKQHKRCADEELPCSGIVYVHKRDDTTEIAHLIRKECGIVAEAYHGGLNKDERTRILEAWTAGKAQIAVATVAFGMGIDLAHVRYVIHWSMSKSIEAFYQESGRAGRDGLPAFSLLYCDMSEPSKFRWLVNMQAKKAKDPKEPVNELAAIDEMEKYCVEPGCRRFRLLKHFGQQTENLTQLCNTTCDFCQNPAKVERAIKAATAAFNTVSTAMTTFNFGEYDNPYGDHNRNIAEDEEEEYDEIDVNRNSADGLQLTSAGLPLYAEAFPVDDDHANMPSANFVKASAVLSKYSKYEAKECSASTGFVNFREKVARAEMADGVCGNDRVRIPQHLIPVKNPTARATTKTSEPEKKSSKDYAAEAERLRAELAKAKEAGAALHQSLKKARALPPPPPTLSFKTKRN